MQQARIIYLKDRSFNMLKKDIILRNPLRRIGHGTEDILPEGGFGAVLARAGVGKTAFLVQLSLNFLLMSKNVLHISLDNPVSKVCLWYKEIFNRLATQYNLQERERVWESLQPHRFIMTFNVDGFSVPRFEERLNELTEQEIFSPNVIIVDGLLFDESVQSTLSDLKVLAKKHSMHFWFTVHTHRHEKPGSDGMPPQLKDVSDLFDLVIQLQPEGKDIHVRTLKKGESAPFDQPELVMDPSTMLLKAIG